MESTHTSRREALQGTLLIVDDTPENLGFLFDYLTSMRFKILVAQDGEEALERLEHVLPDLVLLDVMMPGIDGFETCKRIKEIPRARDIPVIFMTALVETEHKLRAFAAGAVDYVTKPLSPGEIQARVGIQLRLRSLQRQLEERNRDLMAFGHTLAHDIRTWLAGIVGMAECILTDAGDQPYAQAPRDDIELILHAGTRIQETMESLIHLSGFEGSAIQLDKLDMPAILARVLDELDPTIRERTADVIVPERWPHALGVALWVERIWANYIENAVKYSGESPRIELGAYPGDAGRVCFWVRDIGPGITADQQTLIFQPFARLPGSRQNGHGLGLAIVERIANRLGGHAGVRAAPGGGAEFYFELPGAA